MNYDRVILELMERVSVLEDEVEALKSKFYNDEDAEETEDIFGMSSDSAGRDTTKYILDGKRFGKNRLVLAIVKKYMKEHPDTTSEQLLSTFDRSLQGSLGVVRELDEVKRSYSDYERRFFISSNEVIRTATETCVVCTQWKKDNIGNMVARAKQLGIEITSVK